VTPLVLSEPPAEIPDWLTVVIWAVGERLLTFHDIRARVWRSRHDRGSHLWIVGGVAGGFLVAVALASRDVLALPAPAVYLVIGLVLAWVGMLLRLWAVLTLGRSFTTVVLVRADQRVITSGPYRLVRHPSYLGLLILFLGLGLGLGDLAGGAALVVLPPIALVNRIMVEEAALRGRLGDSYVEYSKSRARLISGVW
jgi:protein-S-isoprenylcysteine O-methyltransferase Ste14